MGWQTLEYLKSRKIDNWLKKGVITKQQYKDIVYHYVEYGFWAALGYATYLKYKNIPKLKKKYEYKWLNIPKKECLLHNYITTGRILSNKKRRRIWYNVFFCKDGTERIPKICSEFPGWEIFYIKHNVFRVGLRRPIDCHLAVDQFES